MVTPASASGRAFRTARTESPARDQIRSVAKGTPEPKRGPFFMRRAARRSGESEGLGPEWEGDPGPPRPEVGVPGHLRRYRTPEGAPCTNFGVRQRLTVAVGQPTFALSGGSLVNLLDVQIAVSTLLSGAVDRAFEGGADGAHLGVGKPAKPAD